MHALGACFGFMCKLAVHCTAATAAGEALHQPHRLCPAQPVGLLGLDPNELVGGRTPLHYLLACKSPPAVAQPARGRWGQEEEEDEEWGEERWVERSSDPSAPTLVQFLDR